MCRNTTFFAVSRLAVCAIISSRAPMRKYEFAHAPWGSSRNKCRKWNKTEGAASDGCWEGRRGVNEGGKHTGAALSCRRRETRSYGLLYSPMRGIKSTWFLLSLFVLFLNRTLIVLLLLLLLLLLYEVTCFLMKAQNQLHTTT